MRFDVLTTFPEMFAWHPAAPAELAGRPAMSVSIPARARAAGLVSWHAHNIRDFAGNKHDKTDDRPFGGGPGMVMMCQPIWDCVAHVEALDPRPATRILLTPQGVPLRQAIVRELAAKPRLLMIAGHYEGIDERVIARLAPMEISLGDYVLSGGELGAMILIDAVTRLIPGALGHAQSAHQDSFEGDGLLDTPHYTRPREWMREPVPDVLLSGDHEAIARWRQEQAPKPNTNARPDLI